MLRMRPRPCWWATPPESAAEARGAGRRSLASGCGPFAHRCARDRRRPRGAGSRRVPPPPRDHRDHRRLGRGCRRDLAPPLRAPASPHAPHPVGAPRPAHAAPFRSLGREGRRRPLSACLRAPPRSPSAVRDRGAADRARRRHLACDHFRRRRHGTPGGPRDRLQQPPDRAAVARTGDVHRGDPARLPIPRCRALRRKKRSRRRGGQLGRRDRRGPRRARRRRGATGGPDSAEHRPASARPHPDDPHRHSDGLPSRVVHGPREPAPAAPGRGRSHPPTACRPHAPGSSRSSARRRSPRRSTSASWPRCAPAR